MKISYSFHNSISLKNNKLTNEYLIVPENFVGYVKITSKNLLFDPKHSTPPDFGFRSPHPVVSWTSFTNDPLYENLLTQNVNKNQNQ